MMHLDWGTAARPYRDGPCSGDAYVVDEWESGALVAAIDGLGHGAEAQEAALAAVELLRSDAQAPLGDLIRRCHTALARTRGAVMTLAHFDLGAGTLTWTGVGNVEARLLRAGEPAGIPGEPSPILHGGVVGYTLPTIRESQVGVAIGDTLILATDGVRADFATGLLPTGRPADLAQRILSSHADGGDDALVVVARVLP